MIDCGQHNLVRGRPTIVAADLVVRLSVLIVHRNARKGVGVLQHCTLKERANPPEKGSCCGVPITQRARDHTGLVLYGCIECCDALDQMNNIHLGANKSMGITFALSIDTYCRYATLSNCGEQQTTMRYQGCIHITAGHKDCG